MAAQQKRCFGKHKKHTALWHHKKKHTALQQHEKYAALWQHKKHDALWQHKESDAKEMHIDDGASDIAPIFRSVSQVLEESSEALGEDLTSVDPKEVLRGAFAPTPQKRAPPVLHVPCDTLDAPSPPAASFSNPITFLKDPTFRPVGVLPNGFPEARDLNKDAQAGKIPVKGQSRFSKIDVLCPAPLFYHDTTPLPPTSLLAALNPPPQILIYGDGIQYPGFLRSFSVADLPTLEWNKLAGLAIFVLLPSFAPFEDEPPFLSHRSIIKQLVSLLCYSKKNNKVTTIWLAYCSRSNVADCEFASILDRRIDIIPALSFLYVSVVCSIIHLAHRHPDTHAIVDNASPLDHPLILMHLSSTPFPKGHIPRTIEFFPKDTVCAEDPAIFTPETVFQLRLDILS